MSITPIITFKAGQCELDQSSKPYKVKAQPTPGYIYLYSEDDLIHFCWRPRDQPLDQPELDLLMFPTDGHFLPLDSKNPENPSAKTNGRIVVLKFSSSPQRHIFWLQSKPQAPNGDAASFSRRDKKICDVVHRLLQGDEVDINRELAQVRSGRPDDSPEDDDEPMEDVEGHGDGAHHGGSGGAGPDATGGDVRREGEDAREGGADGARAASSSAPDAAAAVRNFLDSLKGDAGFGAQQQQQQGDGKLFPLLSDLLEAPVTVPMVDGLGEGDIDNMLSFLPPSIIILSQQGTDGDSVALEPSAESVNAAKEAMSLTQKKALLKKVLRSPQFHQSLTSLTMAIRDGGLPTVSAALRLDVENGGLMKGGSMPLGGGEAVEAFVEAVKKDAQKK